MILLICEQSGGWRGFDTVYRLFRNKRLQFWLDQTNLRVRLVAFTIRTEVYTAQTRRLGLVTFDSSSPIVINMMALDADSM